ncbi:hypothetical protein ACFQE1_01790 [Halobium palmae]|uniref:Uncharacterized protein n=1 Tax=Halobium palmae TaxID=1776492 RepID=A0ABD5RWL2_9EURY
MGERRTVVREYEIVDDGADTSLSGWVKQWLKFFGGILTIIFAGLVMLVAIEVFFDPSPVFVLAWLVGIVLVGRVFGKLTGVL